MKLLLGVIFSLALSACQSASTRELPPECREALRKWEVLIARMKKNTEFPPRAIEVMVKHKLFFEEILKKTTASEDKVIVACHDAISDSEDQLKIVDTLKAEEVYKYFPRN